MQTQDRQVGMTEVKILVEGYAIEDSKKCGTGETRPPITLAKDKNLTIVVDPRLWKTRKSSTNLQKIRRSMSLSAETMTCARVLFENCRQICAGLGFCRRLKLSSHLAILHSLVRVATRYSLLASRCFTLIEPRCQKEGPSKFTFGQSRKEEV
jgi:hypothetical protein